MLEMLNASLRLLSLFKKKQNRALCCIDMVLIKTL